MKALIIISFLVAITALGGMRRNPVPHAITSPGKHFVFTMVPGPANQEHKQGFGICYKIASDGTFAEIWRTKGWYSEDLELHYDGDLLVRIGSWGSGDQETNLGEESLAIAFYKLGKEVVRYKINDLVKEKDKLQYSEGGLQWLIYEGFASPGFSSDGKHFRLKTIDNISYRFESSTGKIVYHQK